MNEAGPRPGGHGPAPFQAVLFDAAGTLFRARPPVPELLSGLVAEAGHPVGVQRVAAAVSQVESAHGVPDDAPDPESRHAYWTGHVTRILGAARVPADPGTLESVARAAASAITDPAAYELVPGVPSLLDAVEKAGLPMGIVSNFDDLLFGILDGTGLSERFDVVVTSYRFGVYKPDPAIFREGARLIGADPLSTWFLGDSPYSDMQGAQRAGMTGVLYDPGGTKTGYEGRRVTCMPEFKRLIGV